MTGGDGSGCSGASCVVACTDKADGGRGEEEVASFAIAFEVTRKQLVWMSGKNMLSRST